MHSVYIIEDETLLRELLETFFEATFPDIQLLGSSEDGADGLQQCLEQKPDLALLDINLPTLNGLEVLQTLKEKQPETKVILFTGKTSRSLIKKAIQHDADGYISKHTGVSEIEKALQKLKNNQVHYSPAIQLEVDRIQALGE